MVSRSSAFALTVMLLVSATAQASWLPSMPSLPSLPSLSSVFNKNNGVFVAKVAASLFVFDIARKVGSKVWSYAPACVSTHAANAHDAIHSRVPAFLKTAPAGCQVNARLSVLEGRRICTCTHAAASADLKKDSEPTTSAAASDLEEARLKLLADKK